MQRMNGEPMKPALAKVSPAAEAGSARIPSSKRERSLALKVFDFLSGFGLATILLLLLGLLTWLATLEQIDRGLFLTLRKYFHWKSVFLLPEINGKTVPLPLPGGYWVGALLLVNLVLGGVIRIRKGWSHAGNLIAHLGIVLMLVAGGVAHHAEERGNMAVGEGETNDAAEDYFEYVVEVSEVVGEKVGKVHVIRGAQIEDLADGSSRLFRFPELPFDLKLAGFFRNCLPVAETEQAPRAGEPVFEGYFLMQRPDEVQAERNTAGTHARVVLRDGSEEPPFLLAGASFHPKTVRVGGRVFLIDMRKRLWPMPFQVRLDTFVAEFHPGTSNPAKFESEITRIERGRDASVRIRMNEPMRYEGLTFFQASYGPQGAKPGEKMFSVFEVVRNPADKWPEYSLYIVAFGMLVTFLTRLISFLLATRGKQRHV